MKNHGLRKLLTVLFIMAVLTALSLSVSAIEATEAVSIDVNNYGTYGFTSENYNNYLGYYAITNAEQLYWFAQQAGGGNNSINGVLTADITVNADVNTGDKSLLEKWTPIGDNGNSYEGAFDGNGHTVSGLYFDDADKNYVGLFGDVGSSGTVQNVGVINSYIRGDEWVGGVCGDSDGGTITNCYYLDTDETDSLDGTIYKTTAQFSSPTVRLHMR